MTRKHLRLILAISQLFLLIGLWLLGTVQKKNFCEASPWWCNATDVDVTPAWNAIFVIDFPLVIALAPLEALAPAHNLPDWAFFSVLACVTPFFRFGLAGVVESHISQRPPANERDRRSPWGLRILFLALTGTAAVAWASFVGDHSLGRWLKLGAAVWSTLAAAVCLAKIVLVRETPQLSSTGSG
jgi:hypothetical protein